MPDAEPAAPATQTWKPPYVAFQTLLNLILRMEREDIPTRIDRTYLTGSEGSKTQVIAALKSLDLIAADGTISERLVHLVREPDNRKALIRGVLEAHFQGPLALPSTATQGQLEEAFGGYGLSGDTRRKAISFFLKGAKYAGMTLSRNFRTPASGVRRKGTRAKGESEQQDDQGDTGEQGDPIDDLKARYIDMLLKKADEKDDMDDDLLNRIEKLLGFEEREG